MTAFIPNPSPTLGWAQGTCPSALPGATGREQAHHTQELHLFVSFYLSRGGGGSREAAPKATELPPGPRGLLAQPLFPLPAGRQAAVELAVGGQGPHVRLGALAGAVADLGAVLPHLPVACKRKAEGECLG